MTEETRKAAEGFIKQGLENKLTQLRGAWREGKLAAGHNAIIDMRTMLSKIERTLEHDALRNWEDTV